MTCRPRTERVRSSNAPAATTNANAWLTPPVDSVPLNDASSPVCLSPPPGLTAGHQAERRADRTQGVGPVAPSSFVDLGSPAGQWTGHQRGEASGEKVWATEIARTTAAALFWDSWSSVAGSESATIPPPA